MDPSPPPLPSHPIAVTAMHLNCPESADSSPRKAADTWDQPLAPVPGAKLRLMCSYGGHIIPRPHDKTLCYMGGETRMIVVDRSSPLAELSSRLSRTLLNGRQFTLKYQLPNEDLDNLISVTTNEDLDNMIEEYDRITAASPLKSSRLRLFLFFSKPETAASMGSLLDDAKSETWFVDALNGTGLLPRGLSDSAAAIDCFLDGNASGDSEAQTESLCNAKGSPVVDTSSSFGSSSSSPSMASLPPIRVRVEDGGLRHHDQMVGLEEEFSYMSTIPHTVVQKQDEGFVVMPAPPPLPSSSIVGVSAAESGENPSRVFSDDERSDQGMRVRFRKPPLPLQPVQRRADDAFNLPSPDSKHGGFNFPSPDSVASDSSIASATSFSRPIAYQDPVHVTAAKDNKPPIPIDPKKDIPDIMSSQIQAPQVQESCYALPSQAADLHQQPPVVHPSMHYIHHPPTAPISSYYPLYAPPPQNLQQQQQQLHHHPMDQQYPVYLLPVTQPQTYNLPLQSNVAADSTPVVPGRALTPPTPAMVTPCGVYKEMSTHQPIYTKKSVQIPSNQFHQQHPYVGFSHLHHPQPQSIAAAAAPNYACDYAHPAQDQACCAHHSVVPLPVPQYQTLTSTAAVAFSEAKTQYPVDNTMQQIITPQPHHD